MFTNWSQVESWIRDNHFAHWIFTKSAPSERDEKTNDKIVDSNAFTGDYEDKIAMTKKYLEWNGGRAFGIAWDSPKTNIGGSTCEVRLEADIAPTQGVGQAAQPFNTGELRDSITRELRAQFELENMKKREADLDKREKELNDRENSAMGAVVKLLAPVGKAMMERAQFRNVAGIDADEPVHAQPIVVDRPEQPAAPGTEQPKDEPKDEPENESEFTESEEATIYDLMSRFKKVEPDYLTLIARVVEMAESGDSTYTMAKGVLVK